jgi:hypothetical protein
MGPYLLRDRLTAQRYHDFLETALSWLFEEVLLAVMQMLWFQNDEVPPRYGGRHLVMIEHGTFREVDWTLNGR